MTSERELEALAAEGLDYFEKAGDDGDKGYVRAIRELLARRLQPARVPEGWREFIEECAKAAGGEVCGNALSRRAAALLSAAPAAEGVAQTSDSWDAIERHCVVSEAVAPDRADPYGTIGRLIDYHANPAPESREADHSVGVNKMVPEAGQREGVEAVKQSLTGGKANE